MPRPAQPSGTLPVARRRLLTVVLALIVIVLSGAGTALAASRPTGPWGSATRHFIRESVVLPSGRQFDVQYDRPSWRPAPLIVMLPGLNQTPAQLESVSSAYEFGRTTGATIVYGRAVPASGGLPAWNAGGCCAGQGADDVTYLRDVVTAAEQMTSIDAHRVYVIGMSNGGMMALRALCAAPDIFAAAVSVAGPYLGTTCPRPTWLHLAGTADRIVPIAGGRSSMSSVCGCTFPATTTEAQRFRGAQVQLVPGANHTWPQVGDHTWRFDGMQRAWAFLQPLSLPS